MFPSLYVAGASWHVVMVLIFFVDGLWVRHAREQGVSNTLLGDQRVCGRRDRIGLDSAVVAATLPRGGAGLR